MIFTVKLYLIFITLIIPTLLLGRTIELFNTDGTQNIKAYQRYIPKRGSIPGKNSEILKNGDILKMPDGREFRFEGLLGRGMRTYVYRAIQTAPLDEVTNTPIALKIPLTSSKLTLASMSSYTETIQQFFNHGINTVKIIHTPATKITPYIAIELLPQTLPLTSAISVASKKGNNSAEYKALLKFAKETAHLTKVGDTHIEQLVFDEVKKEYVLLDGENFVRKYTGSPLTKNEPNILTGEYSLLSTGRSVYIPVSEEEEQLITDIENTIEKERLKIKDQNWNHLQSLKQTMKNPPPTTSFDEYYKTLQELELYGELPSFEEIPHLFSFEKKPTSEQLYNLLRFKNGVIPSNRSISEVYKKIPKDETFLKFYDLYLSKFEESIEINSEGNLEVNKVITHELKTAKAEIIKKLLRDKRAILKLQDGDKLLDKISAPNLLTICLRHILKTLQL